MELFYLNRGEGGGGGKGRAGEMELFYLNRGETAGRRDGAVLSEQKEEGGQERWSCFF